MLRHALVAALLAIGTASLAAQQPPAVSAPTPDALKPPSSPFPLDPANYAAAVRDSYYHPDGLSALDCKVSIDWVAFFASLKTPAPPERLKALQGLIAHAHSPRNKVPEITFDWTAGVLDTKDHMEASMKQMIGGFYQMYWPMFASSPIKNASDIKKIEPQPDGSSVLYMQSGNSTTNVTIDKDKIPVHYTFDNPAMKGTIDPSYTPSPNPVPGDLRRLTGVKVFDQVGTSTMNVDVTLDYQSVQGLYIPQHATFAVGGAYSIQINFSDCAVTREISVAPETKAAPATK